MPTVDSIVLVGQGIRGDDARVALPSRHLAICDLNAYALLMVKSSILSQPMYNVCQADSWWRHFLTNTSRRHHVPVRLPSGAARCLGGTGGCPWAAMWAEVHVCA